MKKHIALLSFLMFSYAQAKVELPLIFSDGMVLQQNKPIAVWGWAKANEKVTINFKNQSVKTKASKNGKWQVTLKAEKAGGPFKMIVKGSNTINLQDVYIGEVWLCSGQSNMEWAVENSNNYTEELKDANYPLIRQFLVEKDMSSTPKKHLKGGNWSVCNAKTVCNFTAVGYFFARQLYKELQVPIGIIHSSWGGTCVETWTSKTAFQNSDEFKSMILEMPEVDINLLAENQMKSIIENIERIQGSRVESANESEFKNAVFNDSNWPEMHAPELWENQQLPSLDGTVWMRKAIKISKSDVNQEALIELAKIDDLDSTYVNGVFIGTTKRYDENRKYTIPKNVLKEGENVIAIRIFDYAGGGGIWGDASNLKITTANNVVSLAGNWKFHVADVKSQISPNSYPSLLYNAMINPLIPYTFQGALWYQGEANVDRAVQYKKAFPLMIEDWRTQWNMGDFPFYFVQLSTFDEHGGNSNKGSKWAELREAQTETLSIKNTGMAVTTDIGNPNDIHPRNKQDVGKRLAAIALNKVYKRDTVFSGPTYQSMVVENNKIVLRFDNVGSGLITYDKYGYLHGFEIAGKDQVFKYAKAEIKNNIIIVYHDDIVNPVAIRYGWSDDASDCDLFNAEGFPARPFRTDNWETLTYSEKYKF